MRESFSLFHCYFNKKELDDSDDDQDYSDDDQYYKYYQEMFILNTHFKEFLISLLKILRSVLKNKLVTLDSHIIKMFNDLIDSINELKNMVCYVQMIYFQFNPEIYTALSRSARKEKKRWQS